MILRQFGRDEHPFVLKTAQWRDLEKTRDCGLGIIVQRITPLVRLKLGGLAAYGGDMLLAVASGCFGDARLDDVREPLLQGLIGGGMTSTEAGALVRLVFDRETDSTHAAMYGWCDLAFSILTEAMIGLSDETEDEDDAPAGRDGLGEPEAAAKPARRSKTARPGSQTSTAPSA